MNEKKDEELEKDFDDKEIDLTKDAFFSDLMSMEEEIASEAYELVEHALNLIETKYYDDGIEILRQAIGLYTQINREDEIKAINEKIADVYILKEQEFRKSEIVPLKGIEVVEKEQEIIYSKPDLEEPKVELLNKAKELIFEAEQLINSQKFEEALGKYDEAVNFYEKMNQIDEIDRIYELIEECYNKKAEFLRSVKKERPLEEVKVELEQEDLLSAEKLKEEKLQKFLLSKKREEEISSKAYDLLGQAAELTKTFQYDKALELYKEGIALFQELNWTYEIQKIEDTINQLEKEKDEHLKELEKQRIEKEKEMEVQMQQAILIEQISKEEQIEKSAKLEKLKEIEMLKLEEDFFKAQIAKMANEAEKKARNYEISMKKSIKEGKPIENCIYPEVIDTYNNIKKLLIKKGWNKEAIIYDNTINIYQQKLEQDKKIRQIEAEKLLKQQEAEEALKAKIEQIKVPIDEEQLKLTEEQKRKENELQILRKNLEDMTARAERLAREYEVALRKGRFELKCPYPEIINIYENANQMAIEKGLEEDIVIFTSQIQAYSVKLEKDMKLRQIEEEKAIKQKEAEELLKIQKEEKKLGLDLEKLKEIEAEKIKEEEDELNKLIEGMTNRAEKMAREYDLALKKAIRKGKLVENPPFDEIIKIYDRARQMALSKGKDQEVKIFLNQIRVYTEKKEKDNKLREVEAQKIQKQKEIEELYKLGKKAKIEKEKLEDIKRKKEEEDFENYIIEKVNHAEKLVRDYEIAMRKALREGETLQRSPYSEVIKTYEQLYEQVLAKGWKDQAQIYSNQVKIYQDKLEKHKKLLEVEAQKADEQEDVKELQRTRKKTGLNEGTSRVIEKKKEIEEFELLITEMMNDAERLEREYESKLKKAIKKGKIIEVTPYPKIIEIYNEIREKVKGKGWTDQVKMYTDQIKLYQEKLEKHKKMLEVEAQKALRQKEIEEMHKLGKKEKIDERSLKSIEIEKENEEFGLIITDMINKAERLEREYESKMKKAIKKGKIVETTPYLEIIDIYKEIREKLKEKGWTDQVIIYTNQIKLYQEKLEKHKKMLKVEAQKALRQKEIEEMHKLGKKEKLDEKSLKSIEIKKEDEEFELLITEMINDAERLEREYESKLKKAIKKGKIIETTPYLEIIDIYKEIKEKVKEKGWIDQVKMYTDQIKLYQEKLEKHEKILEVEAQKARRQKEIEEMHKAGKKEFQPVKPEKIKEIEQEAKEEDILLDNAMNLIDEAEKLVKKYELSIKKDILLLESPYEIAISNYEEAHKIFQNIGWDDEAKNLIKTIKFYKEKKEKDEKLRVLEKNKLEESELEVVSVETESEKEILERRQRILKFEQQKKQVDQIAAEIFNMIQEAERIAQEYELKIKAGVFDYEAPYGKVIEIYREARKRFEKIGWKEESIKLIDTIKYYKEKLEQDEKIRAIEAEKIKKREEELLIQQRMLKIAREEQERLVKEREESLLIRKQRVAQFETQKDKAFRLMDQAKRELRQNNFNKAIEFYKESEQIFLDMKWDEGIIMVQDSIGMINNKKKEFELEQQAIEERRREKLLLEEKFEEKLAEADAIRKIQKEEKRKEILRIQREKEQEKEVSEEAYELLEEGTAFMERNKFDDAYQKYISARDLFEKISWEREVSRINNELLFKLKRERKKFEALEDIKKKKIEEERKLKEFKEETAKERRELEIKKKEEKRRLAKEDLDRKVSKELDKAYNLIDNYRFNEGILLFREEINKLRRLGRDDDINEIYKQINNLKSRTEIPLITWELSVEGNEKESFKSAYLSLDRAQVSLINDYYMKAISELNEALYNLKQIKKGEKFINEIRDKIHELNIKLGKKPTKEESKMIEEEHNEELAQLRARIAARREERRKKVMELLKKSKD